MASSRGAQQGKTAAAGPGKPAARSRRPRDKYADLKKLTPLLERFCVEFCLDFNASAAWVRAHVALNKPVPKAAQASAWNAMQSPLIQAQIKAAREAALKAAGITVEKTELEIARLAYVDIALLYDDNNCLLPVRQMPEEARRAVLSVETDELFDFSDEEDVRRRLSEIEVLVGTLAGAIAAKQTWPELEPHVRRVVEWQKPKKVTAQKYLIGYTRKLKIADKKGALELAGRRDAIFKDKVEHSVSASLEQILAESHKVPAHG